MYTEESLLKYVFINMEKYWEKGSFIKENKNTRNQATPVVLQNWFVRSRKFSLHPGEPAIVSLF